MYLTISKFRAAIEDDLHNGEYVTIRTVSHMNKIKAVCNLCVGRRTLGQTHL